jgi:uncharacterized protein YbjT (DUF2867 family)
VSGTCVTTGWSSDSTARSGSHVIFDPNHVIHAEYSKPAAAVVRQALIVILVTGATGTNGRHIVRLLAGRDVLYRAMTRQPAQVPGGVFGDFDDPASLLAAADGVETLFLLTSGGSSTPAHDRAMLDAATRSGVRKVVKLSVIDIGPVADWHRPGEDALRDSEFAWTVLKPTTFASNSLRWATMIRRGEPIPNATGNGRQGVIDPRDIAEVAVEALLTGEHEGRTYTLTGPELLTVADQAAMLSEILGKPVTTVDITVADLRANLIASGMPEEFADVAATGSELVLAGRNAILTPDVTQVLQRAPRSFAVWATDHRAAFG